MPLLCRLLGWPRRVKQPRRECDSSEGYAEVHAVPASHLTHPFPKVDAAQARETTPRDAYRRGMS